MKAVVLIAILSIVQGSLTLSTAHAGRRPYTEEEKKAAKLRKKERQKERYHEDLGYRERQKERQKERREDSDYRERENERKKKRRDNPDYRERENERKKERQKERYHEDQDYRARVLERSKMWRERKKEAIIAMEPEALKELHNGIQVRSEFNRQHSGNIPNTAVDTFIEAYQRYASTFQGLPNMEQEAEPSTPSEVTQYKVLGDFLSFWTAEESGNNSETFDQVLEDLLGSIVISDQEVEQESDQESDQESKESSEDDSNQGYLEYVNINDVRDS